MVSANPNPNPKLHPNPNPVPVPCPNPNPNPSPSPSPKPNPNPNPIPYPNPIPNSDEVVSRLEMVPGEDRRVTALRAVVILLMAATLLLGERADFGLSAEVAPLPLVRC